VGLAVLVVVGTLIVNLATSLPNLSTADREVYDTDGYMRLLRVEELTTGEVGWFESWAPRSNAPFGHSMHWTRPLDVLVISASAVPFLVGIKDPLYWGALWLGPALHALLALAIGWAAWPLVGRRAWLLAALGAVVQPALLAYGAAGRVDHHVLIYLSTALVIGSVLRYLPGGDRADRFTIGAGVAAGLGLWASVEVLLPIALVVASGVVAWVALGGGLARLHARFSGAWFLTTLAALICERGWRGLGAVELDRISIVHAALAGGAWLTWLAAARLGGNRRLHRAMRFAGIGVPVTLAFLAVFPDFLRGPFGMVPAELDRVWLSGVVELHPLWPLGPDVLRSVYFLGAAVGGTALAGWAWKRGPAGERTQWGFVVGSLLAAIALGLTQLRLSAFAQIFATIPWAWASGRMLSRVGDRRSPMASAGRLGSMVAGVAGFLLPVLVAAAVGRIGETTTPSGATCSVPDLANVLAQLEVPEPIVLGNVDIGPELLFRSDARVVASPYHRNVEGILDARRAMVGDEQEAAKIVERRGIDFLVVCPARDGNYLGPDGDRQDAMFARLTSGRSPAWLAPLTSVEADRSGFLVFRVTSGVHGDLG
jgi:hypothetical protein